MIQCPKCSFGQPDQNIECPRCGIIIDKYHRLQETTSQTKTSVVTQAESAPAIAEVIKELLFYVKPEINLLRFCGRVLFFLVIFIWGLKFIKALEKIFARIQNQRVKGPANRLDVSGPWAEQMDAAKLLGISRSTLYRFFDQ